MLEGDFQCSVHMAYLEEFSLFKQKKKNINNLYNFLLLLTYILHLNLIIYRQAVTVCPALLRLNKTLTIQASLEQ